MPLSLSVQTKAGQGPQKNGNETTPPRKPVLRVRLVPGYASAENLAVLVCASELMTLFTNNKRSYSVSFLFSASRIAETKKMTPDRVRRHRWKELWIQQKKGMPWYPVRLRPAKARRRTETNDTPKKIILRVRRVPGYASAENLAVLVCASESMAPFY